MKPATQTPAATGRRARLEQQIASVLRRMGLYTLVHTLYGRWFKPYRGKPLPAHGAAFRPTQLAQLTPEARKIYTDLKDARRRRRQGGG